PLNALCTSRHSPSLDVHSFPTRRSSDLQRLLDRDIFNLSGGEKQLIACIGVTVCQHDLIVLDEPSSNLDFITVSKLRKMIDKWKDRKSTRLNSSHVSISYAVFCLKKKKM